MAFHGSRMAPMLLSLMASNGTIGGKAMSNGTITVEYLKVSYDVNEMITGL